MDATLGPAIGDHCIVKGIPGVNSATLIFVRGFQPANDINPRRRFARVRSDVALNPPQCGDNRQQLPICGRGLARCVSGQGYRIKDHPRMYPKAKPVSGEQLKDNWEDR
jgi:hypothetical protein